MKKILASILMLCASATMWAQYTIYPIPQKMTAIDGTASFSGNVCLICDESIDQATKNRAQQVLEEHGLTCSFTTGEQDCTSAIYLKVDPTVAVKNKYDAHKLELNAMSNGMVSLTITGQNTDATFMGLASLEQMLDEKGITALPCVSITDYADQQQRGLVEGYYGYPYSVEVKKDLMRFMMRMKMNTYLYGAKSDPYHSEYWKDAYPTTITDQQEANGWMSQDMIRDVCETSAATKVNFIWAIHPGNNFLGSSTVVTDIVNKFTKMYNLGVRQFGIFVDDVSVPSSDDDLALNASRLTQIQQKIEAKWNKADALPADTVKPIHFVPQIYCRSFASSDDQYQRFFKALAATPKHVVIYTTGNGVWSVPNASDFATPKQYLGREVAWWWNYPCNDNADSQLFPMDMYQNFVDMPAVSGSATLPTNLGGGIGIVSNPMQEGEVAKIPLFSVADYAWNNAKFNNKNSWNASFPFIFEVGENRNNGDRETLANALKTLAPFLTYNDPTNKFASSLSASKMQNTITELLDAIAIVKSYEESNLENDKLMWRDLRPWILKLEQMLNATSTFLNAKTGDSLESRWMEYVKALDIIDDFATNDAYQAYSLEGMGTGVSTAHRICQPSQKYLMPFLETLKTTVLKDAFPKASTAAKGFSNTSYTPTAKLADNIAYMSIAAHAYEPGEYLGFTLPRASRMAEVLVADTLCQNHCVLFSENGRDWNRIEPTGNDIKSYDGYVKYVLVGNSSEATTSFKVAKSALQLTLIAEPTLESITAPVEKDYNDRSNISDNDLTTFWCPYADQVTGDVICLNLSGSAPIQKVRFAIHTTNGDYMKTGRIEISQDGSKWTKLSPIGSTKTSFTLSDMTPVDGSGNTISSSEAYIYQLYFNGKAQEAKYIRFYNQSATSNKWIRIAEFTPVYDVTTTPCDDNPAICDALPYTYESLLNAQYDFQQINALESVTIYSGTQGENSLGIYGKDSVHDIYPLGSITGPVTTIDLSGYPYLHSLCFETPDGGVSASTKIYEVVPTVSSNLPSLDFYTAIRNVYMNETQTTEPSTNWYDLMGRKVNNPAHGIYIINGKKVLR